MLDQGLVWTGKITSLEDIPGADFIVQATVVCGAGGKWRGVVRKGDFLINWSCRVFLPDSILPEKEEYRFLEKNKWRVKMCRFKGAASEVLIMPDDHLSISLGIGIDVTNTYGVVKYFKPVPANLNGIAKGAFPSFLRKTDEINYQMHGDLVDKLAGQPFYITQKCDGNSTTAFRYKGEFGVCSRNLELLRDPENGYWKVAAKYHLEERLPEGFAIQFETCGPGIQSNPMGLKEIDGFAFSGWDIENRRYLDMHELWYLCDKLQMPMCDIVNYDDSFDPNCLKWIGVGYYKNDNPQEGVVIRSQKNIASPESDHPISFKVINLDYEK
jgi:RNA ligase (TIGR02306 family)